MKQMNTLANPAAQAKKSFSTIINSNTYRPMIDRSVGDPARSAALVSTLISVVNATPKLKDCDPGTVIAAALRGEIGMGLSVALGEYAIIPYGSTATFQIQVNGIKRLAVRSGQYRKVILRDVRKGEFAGYDDDGDPVIHWSKDENREELPIVGYYGCYVLMNGFTQRIYWTHAKIMKHADTYAKAFKGKGGLKIYNELVNGKLDDDTVAKLQDGSPWFALPDTTAHQKMCLKTIAKQLFGDGLAPKEVMQAIQADDMAERSNEPVIYEDQANYGGAHGEVIEGTAVITDAPDQEDAPADDFKAPVSDDGKKGNDTPDKPAKRTTKQQSQPESQEKDFTNGFFD